MAFNTDEVRKKLAEFCVQHPDVGEWFQVLGEATDAADAENAMLQDLANRMGAVIISMLRDQGMTRYVAETAGIGTTDLQVSNGSKDYIEVFIGEGEDEPTPGIKLH